MERDYKILMFVDRVLEKVVIYGICEFKILLIFIEGLVKLKTVGFSSTC